MRNCGELLALYVKQGLLGEATQLAHQYVDAVMGHATQQVRVTFHIAIHATYKHVKKCVPKYHFGCIL